MTKEIEEYVNKFPNIIDPCPNCEVSSNKRDVYSDEGCLGCCFYYPSHFKLKAEIKSNSSPIKLSQKSLNRLKEKKND